MRRLLQVSMLDPCLVFLTLTLTKWKKSVNTTGKSLFKANKVTEFESDLLKDTALQNHEILHM